MKRQRLRVRALIALTLLSCGLTGAQQPPTPLPQPTKQPPVWKVDLRKTGAPEFFHGTTPTGAELTFTDGGHLAVSFVTIDKAWRKVPGPKPGYLHVLTFNAVSGAKETEHQWNGLLPLQLFGLPDGTFLVFTPPSLSLLAPNFDVIRQQTLNAPADSSHVSLSPDRHSILVRMSAGAQHQNEVLDLPELTIRNSWTGDFNASEVSDGWVLESRLETTPQGGRMETRLRNLDQQAGAPIGSSASFVGDGVVMTLAPRKPSTKPVFDAMLDEETSGQLMSVSTVSGDRLFTTELPKRHLFGRQPTIGQNRFAIRECRLRGLTAPDLDLYPFCSDELAVVFDIPQRRAIWAAGLEGTSPWWPPAGHANRLALSPDGKLLAILTNDELRLYKLPD